ncbi:hypothetical protein ACFLY5_00705 [Patescibacteria group bacterium]
MQTDTTQLKTGKGDVLPMKKMIRKSTKTIMAFAGGIPTIRLDFHVFPREDELLPPKKKIYRNVPNPRHRIPAKKFRRKTPRYNDPAMKDD